jgi:hypothetical protein
MDFVSNILLTCFQILVFLTIVPRVVKNYLVYISSLVSRNERRLIKSLDCILTSYNLIYGFVGLTTMLILLAA